jgi:fructose-bisphosphate aldolase class II
MEKRGEFDPRAFMKPAMAALTALCARRFEEFGTAGQAPKLKPVPLPAMAALYARGALDPVIGGAARAA